MSIQTRCIPSFLLLALLTGACASEPTTAPEPSAAVFARTQTYADVAIVTLEPGHPGYLNPEVSFWAKAGKDAEGIIYFADPAERRGRGQAYARFRVRSRSLLAYPDGRPFGPGDSVLISMRVVDPDRILLEMLPSGLRFSASRPAELKIEYSHADPDYNHDGVVDTEDAAIQHVLAIWHQEVPGGPFVMSPSVNFEDKREILAQVFRFSRLAIAY
jgi:hypothetical protein